MSETKPVRIEVRIIDTDPAASWSSMQLGVGTVETELRPDLLTARPNPFVDRAQDAYLNKVGDAAMDAYRAAFGDGR